MDEMMTARQVARLLGLHENWVYDQAAAGGLPSYKFAGTRRFRRDDIESWLAAHRQGVQPAAVSDPSPAAPRVLKRRSGGQTALFAE